MRGEGGTGRQPWKGQAPYAHCFAIGLSPLFSEYSLAWRIKYTRAVLAASLTELFAKSIRQIERLFYPKCSEAIKIRLSGMIKCISILPRKESNLLSEVLGVGALALPIAAGGLPPLRPARPAPAQRNQASESILELKTGRKRNILSDIKSCRLKR